MGYEQFVDDVKRRTGFSRRDLAERAIDATLRVLGERLETRHSHAIAEQLPPPLARSLQRWPFDGEFGLDEFYERISSREGVSSKLAAHHAKVVCQVLREAVNDDGIEHLTADLPEPFAHLFAPLSRRSGP